MAAKRAAMSDEYDAVVCLGVVIRGETSHNEYIAAEVIKGVANVSRNEPPHHSRSSDSGQSRTGHRFAPGRSPEIRDSTPR